MRRQVWKFTLKPHLNRIEMPAGSKLLRAAFQGEVLCLWALVSPNSLKYESKSFVVFGTGHNIDMDNIEFIDTAFIGELVFHVFEVIEK